VSERLGVWVTRGVRVAVGERVGALEELRGELPLEGEDAQVWVDGVLVDLVRGRGRVNKGRARVRVRVRVRVSARVRVRVRVGGKR
jgi:hypothetical protein